MSMILNVVYLSWLPRSGCCIPKTDELFRSLLTYEITMKSHQDVQDKWKKSIALKISIIDEEDDENEASEEDENFTLITRKFKEFIEFGHNKGKKF